ncbi:Signal recognition particle [Klebsiella pneumoniae]|uniref:Signal recognition particle n=1 Tax=Klebsiella pneumoniae TaxID=573 RepID=A0A378AD77_KLEPN|nr:Signal recognition particle [Klebsiella pneumoniae]
MMDEIKHVHAAINPVETLFVVDAMTGQDAANTAKAFNEALPLTGVVLTKVDGDARGRRGAVRFAILPASRLNSSASARKPKRWSRSIRTASLPVSSAWATCCR